MRKVFAILTLTTLFICAPLVDAYSQIVETFTTTTSWTCPTGVTSVSVECWGAGGGGGGIKKNAASRSGGGGGGGGYSKNTAVSVTPGTTYTITVGAGGAGGIGDNNGSNGSSSSFASSVIALGGSGGVTNGAGGTGAGTGTGVIKYAGGNGAAGAGSGSGGGGGGAGSSGNGGAASGMTAGTGTSINGGNGGTGRATQGNGSAGNSYGGGGSGGWQTGNSSNQNGGAGSSGFVQISYACPTISITATAATSPISANSSSTITLTGSTSSLPVGSYTVTYDLSAPNAATGLTATMTVSTAGTGTFTTASLSSAGTTTIAITGLKFSTCTNTTISSNNTANIVVSAAYCNPSGNSSSYYINNFSTTGGTTNITNNSSGFSAGGYGFFGAKVVTQLQGSSVNFSTSFTGGTFGFTIWVDWNQDGDFNDAGEKVYNTTGYVSSTTGSFAVPLSAAAGSTRMRITANYSSTSPSDPCATSISGEFEDYTFTVVALPACSGTPAPGNTLSTANPVCSGVNFTLSLSATFSTSGITYQWQSSPDNATWTNIVGANSATYTGSQTAATYYRCIVACTASGFSGTSTALNVTLNTPANCYCTNTNTTNTSYYISSFSTTGGTTNITNNASGFSANGYGNFTAMTVTQVQNSSINFSITETGGTMHFGIWVDWNNDGDFVDADEQVYINNTTYNTTVTGSFTVPLAAAAGNHRMRVVGNESGTVAACTGTGYTECEDYTLNVTALPICSGIPVPGNTLSTANPVCPNVTFTLSISNTISNSGISYQWQSSPDNTTWTDIAGATSPTYACSQTANTYYRCRVICSNGGGTAYSTTLYETLNNAYTCICTSSATSTSDMDITNVSFGFNNSSSTVSLVGTYGTATGTAGMYSDWRSIVPVSSFMQGSTNAFSITIGGSAYSHRVVVYIDFNHDGDFADAGEDFNVFAYANPTLPNTTNTTITIPLSAATGTTAMRVVCVESSTANPCGTYTWGETEDYLIDIVLATACSGATTGGTASASVTNGCSGYSTLLNVTGATIASGLTYQWESSPTGADPWTAIAGATSQTYTATVTSNLYYRRVTTCTASSSSSNSASIQATIITVANDECANAIALTVNPNYNCGTVTHGSTQCATQSMAGCAGTADDDVWFKFVATATTHRVSLLNTTGTTDVVFQVFSGTCGTLTSLSCSDPNTANITGLTIGQTYYVRVYTYTSGAAYFAGFDVCIGTPPPPPSNDECSAPIVLPVNPANSCNNSASGTIAGATASTQTNSCSGTDDDDVWFTFVAQGTGHTIQLTNISGSVTDMYFAVYSGTCAGTLTNILCSDAEANTVTGLTNGQTYYVRVYTYTSTGDQTTTFNICTFPLACATNDECSSATPLTVNASSACSVTTGGTVYCATASSDATACTSGTDDDDVWYSFVATGSTHTVSLLNIAGSTTDMYFAVYSGTCGSLTSLVCSDANTQSVGGLTATNTYYVRVYTYGSTAGQTSTFNICISSPDESAMCDNASPFCSDTTYNFPTNVSSGSAPAGINYGCLCNQPNPIWYYMKIGIGGPLEITIQSSCGDVDYAAWGPFATQTCDSLTNSGTFDYGSSTSTSCSVDNFESASGNMIDCAYSTASTEYLTIPNSQANQYYLVMINNYANCAGMYTFHQTSGTGKTDCIIVALPVGLYSFTSKCVLENEVELQWTTFTQQNNDHFEVQRMMNGSFETIGIVDGAGNSNEMLQYSFTDFVKTSDVQYYRLRQVDYDGTSSDLKTIPVDCNGDLAFGITSSSLDATTGNLEINFNGLADQDYEINLMDLSGKVIFSDSFTATTDGKNLAVSYFKPVAQGVYVVSLTNRSGITKFSKVSPR